MLKPKEVSLFLKRELSPTEQREAGLALAQANETLSSIEDEKKVATSQFAERIAQQKATIGKYSRIISNGYEMAYIKCRIEYNQPNPREKSILRTDSGAVVEVKAMTEEELQEELDFEAKAGLPSAADLDTVADEHDLSARDYADAVCLPKPKLDKSPRASAKRIDKPKTVSAEGHEAGDEAF